MENPDRLSTILMMHPKSAAFLRTVGVPSIGAEFPRTTSWENKELATVVNTNVVLALVYKYHVLVILNNSPGTL